MLGRVRRGGRQAASAFVGVCWWLVLRLETIAVIAAVGLASSAAWEIGPAWGRGVLALGLLFLGGGISRLVREIRGE